MISVGLITTKRTQKGFVSAEFTIELSAITASLTCAVFVANFHDRSEFSSFVQQEISEFEMRESHHRTAGLLGESAFLGLVFRHALGVELG